MEYSKNYNKKWYDAHMQDPEFRAKRVAQTKEYKLGKKREVYERLLDDIIEWGRATTDKGEVVDKIIAKYKVNERSK